MPVPFKGVLRLEFNILPEGVLTSDADREILFFKYVLLDDDTLFITTDPVPDPIPDSQVTPDRRDDFLLDRLTDAVMTLWESLTSLSISAADSMRLVALDLSLDTAAVVKAEVFAVTVLDGVLDAVADAGRVGVGVVVLVCEIGRAHV